MKKIYNDFYDIVEKRLKKSGLENVSEDCIRYDYFVSLLNNGIDSSDVILEYKHPLYKNREIDCLINTSKEAIEFKFFREIPSKIKNPDSKNNIDRTACMASIISDFYKLLCIDNNQIKIKTSVIVLTDEMIKYINNKKNGFSNLINENEKITINKDLFKDKKHFNDVISKKIGNNLELKDIYLERVFLKDGKTKDDNNFKIIIFRIN